MALLKDDNVMCKAVVRADRFEKQHRSLTGFVSAYSFAVCTGSAESGQFLFVSLK